METGDFVKPVSNDNDDTTTQKDIDEGNKASKRQEARQRLVERQGEAVLNSPDLDNMIDKEVERMSKLAQVPKPQAEGKDVHQSIAESKDNKVHGENIPGQTTRAQNTQNQDVTPSGPNAPSGREPKSKSTDQTSPETGNNTPTKKSNRQ